MDKKTKRGVIIILSVVVILMLVIGLDKWMKYENRFVYEECLDEIALTVDGKEISLRELGYYVYDVEAEIHKQAVKYNPEDPLDYWNTIFNSGTEGWFVTEKAAEIVVDTCVCDLIYESMAVQSGYELTEEEAEAAADQAEKFFGRMSEEQIQATGLTQEIVTTVQKRKALVLKFALEYFEDVDFTGYEGYRETLVSYAGDYYLQEVLPKHEVALNTYITDSLDMGHITVN